MRSLCCLLTGRLKCSSTYGGRGGPPTFDADPWTALHLKPKRRITKTGSDDLRKKEVQMFRKNVDTEEGQRRQSLDGVEINTTFTVIECKVYYKQSITAYAFCSGTSRYRGSNWLKRLHNNLSTLFTRTFSCPLVLQTECRVCT